MTRLVPVQARVEPVSFGRHRIPATKGPSFRGVARAQANSRGILFADATEKEKGSNNKQEAGRQGPGKTTPSSYLHFLMDPNYQHNAAFMKALSDAAARAKSGVTGQHNAMPGMKGEPGAQHTGSAPNTSVGATAAAAALAAAKKASSPRAGPLAPSGAPPAPPVGPNFGSANNFKQETKNQPMSSGQKKRKLPTNAQTRTSSISSSNSSSSSRSSSENENEKEKTKDERIKHEASNDMKMEANSGVASNATAAAKLQNRQQPNGTNKSNKSSHPNDDDDDDEEYEEDEDDEDEDEDDEEGNPAGAGKLDEDEETPGGKPQGRKKKEKGRRKLTWSADEDALLRETLKDFNVKVAENGQSILEGSWSDIAAHIPGRSAKQCRERWCYNLCPTIKREAWTLDEDVRLLQTQRRYGNHWSLIARQIPGRTGDNVKIRFKSILRAARRLWTPQEDEQLIHLHRFVGPNWEYIAEKLGNRTRNAVRNRFQLLAEGGARKPPNPGMPEQVLVDKRHEDLTLYVLSLCRPKAAAASAAAGGGDLDALSNAAGMKGSRKRLSSGIMGRDGSGPSSEDGHSTGSNEESHKGGEIKRLRQGANAMESQFLSELSRLPGLPGMQGQGNPLHSIPGMPQQHPNQPSAALLGMMPHLNWLQQQQQQQNMNLNSMSANSPPSLQNVGSANNAANFTLANMSALDLLKLLPPQALAAAAASGALNQQQQQQQAMLSEMQNLGNMNARNMQGGLGGYPGLQQQQLPNLAQFASLIQQQQQSAGLMSNQHAGNHGGLSQAALASLLSSSANNAMGNAMGRSSSSSSSSSGSAGNGVNSSSLQNSPGNMRGMPIGGGNHLLGLSNLQHLQQQAQQETAPSYGTSSSAGLQQAIRLAAESFRSNPGNMSLQQQQQQQQQQGRRSNSGSVDTNMSVAHLL